MRHFLDMWEGDAGNGGMVVLLRSAASNEYAAGRMREVFAAQVLPAMVRARAGRGDAAARAGLVSSQLLGLALRPLHPQAAAARSHAGREVVAWIGPTVQRYLSMPDPCQRYACGGPAPPAGLRPGFRPPFSPRCSSSASTPGIRPRKAM